MLKDGERLLNSVLKDGERLFNETAQGSGPVQQSLQQVGKRAAVQLMVAPCAWQQPSHPWQSMPCSRACQPPCTLPHCNLIHVRPLILRVCLWTM